MITIYSAQIAEGIKSFFSPGEALLSFRNGVLASDGVIGLWRPEDPDPCNWKGVTCDAKTKRVIALSLTYHKLRGPLPPELGKLDQLRLLMLHNNALYQSIPASLGNCTALEGIYLQNNYITGTIPSEIGNLSGLKNLYVVFFLVLPSGFVFLASLGSAICCSAIYSHHLVSSIIIL
jgi:hypothetical protein